MLSRVIINYETVMYGNYGAGHLFRPFDVNFCGSRCAVLSRVTSGQNCVRRSVSRRFEVPGNSAKVLM